MLTRRTFIQRSALTVGAAALATSPAAALARRGSGYGPLVPGELIDLPRGFRYRVVQNVEDRLSNGAPVPGDFDGMVALRGPRNSTLLVRNHELDPNDVAAGKAPRAWAATRTTRPLRAAPRGSWSARTAARRGSYVTSVGDAEELRRRRHAVGHLGHVRGGPRRLARTDTASRSTRGPGERAEPHADPRHGLLLARGDRRRPRHRHRLPDRGRLPRRPGAAGPRRCPGTTRSSFLYRYLPNNRAQRPGALRRGRARCRCYAIEEPAALQHGPRPHGRALQVVWLDVNAEEPHDDALAQGRRALPAAGGRVLRRRLVLVRRHLRR